MKLRALKECCTTCFNFLINLIKWLKKPILIIWLLITVIDCYSWYITKYAPFRGKKFDREEWLAMAERANDFSDRCPMYTDLTTNYLRIGMSLEEVGELLGLKTPIYYCFNQKVKCYRYSLGNSYVTFLGAPSSAWLDVCFNDINQLISLGKDNHANKICDYRKMLCFNKNKQCECYFGKGNVPAQPCPPGVEIW